MRTHRSQLIVVGIIPLIFLSLTSLLPTQTSDSSPLEPTRADTVWHSPTDEFGRYKNGFIYSPSAIGQLKRIVDSLQLRFVACQPRTFRSVPQARGCYLSMDSKKRNLNAVVKALDGGLSYEEVRNRFHRFIDDSTSQIVITKSRITNYDKEQLVSYRSSPYGNVSPEFVWMSVVELKDSGGLFETDEVKGTWVYNYRTPATGYSEYTLQAFYFEEDFRSPLLPERYARLVQYVDCLVDTTTTIYIGPKPDRFFFSDREHSLHLQSSLEKLERYTDANTDEESRSFIYDPHNPRSWKYLDAVAANDPDFMHALRTAVAIALEEGTSTVELDRLAERYLSKSIALQLKRREYIVGRCRYDDRPRFHALEIATLAAETTSWEIFLRAHLKILNSRVTRTSGDKDALAGRRTYISELEALDIDVHDLLIGTSLDVCDAAPEHYFGEFGRALSESAHRLEFEVRALEMIKDSELDDWNRIDTYFFYARYLYDLEDKKEAIAKINALKQQITEFPAYLYSNIASLQIPE